MKIFKKKPLPEKKVDYYKIEVSYTTQRPYLIENIELKKDIYKNISKKLYCINIEYSGINTTIYSFILARDKKDLEKIKTRIYKEMFYYFESTKISINKVFERTEQFKKLKLISSRKDKLNRITFF